MKYAVEIKATMYVSCEAGSPEEAKELAFAKVEETLGFRPSRCEGEVHVANPQFEKHKKQEKPPTERAEGEEEE